jgi:hypothetical protein
LITFCEEKSVIPVPNANSCEIGFIPHLLKKGVPAEDLILVVRCFVGPPVVRLPPTQFSYASIAPFRDQNGTIMFL